MRILIAGELNVDLVLQNARSLPTSGQETLVDDIALTLGSASAICAAGLAKLGDSVRFVGKVGRDAWGDLCIDSLAKLGVDCRFIQRDPGLKTGVTVSVTSQQDRALITYLGAIEALRAADITDDHLHGQRHLHVSSFFLQRGLRPDLLSLLRRAHQLGLSTSLDPGFDPEEIWTPGLLDALTEVDVFLPNEVELQAITGCNAPDDGLRLLENGRTLTIAKLGREGCMTVHNGEVLKVATVLVPAIDTTGAGDSFNAGFLHAWLHSGQLAHAMRFGCACGALSTLGLGGTASQATEQQALDFIASRYVLDEAHA